MSCLNLQIEAFYKSLGKGDLMQGIQVARKQITLNLFDAVLHSDAPQELKDKAFFAKACYQFAEQYEINNGINL